MSQRSGLGRGLGALIPATPAGGLQELPLSSIRRNVNQPRRTFDPDAIADLAASIRQMGILQPVVVRPATEGEYELVLGERRWRAATRAGLATIPAIIVDTDQTGSLERALVENMHRKDLNPIEEAAAFQQLIEEVGMTHEKLAERVGLSRPAITNALRLLDLPASIQKLVLEEKLTAGHAKALLGLSGHPLLERLGQSVAAQGLSVRETEELVQKTRVEGVQEPSPGDKAGVQRPVVAGLLELGERLSDELQTRVSVTMGRRKGKIVIEFGSVGDLERIYRQITASTKEG